MPQAWLRIDQLPLGAGRLGLCACPGAEGRDLAQDADALARWGADAVLSLLPEPELAALGASGLGAAVQERGMAWLRFPIADFGVPAPEAMARWPGISACARRLTRDGGRLAIHCRAGLGRTGTIAALLLIEAGAPPRRAVAQVRAARPGAIETPAQLRWLFRQAAALRAPGGGA
ncbi:cyclin-dependent kinase inhibitor 3 family protein [Oceanicella actignis]|uniref:Cyclin-dependent kinase inhibitor 3 (CDKN3) n=1 Tax=Oceanicella actignis TaxID=1189325 RepID=A0A1M7SUN6_9RHOB|nr:cyclin-dependent kinase inhibitor 3 family protein [Oceanicella actignis]SES71230.1 Cyclin-dependent kinase inhibitor 3 (CDKN3) [Oceanicella actignis]SHN62086.1 Cyclin-dependent kinase inhibitor 3 (CDKN3) [Oceanicella actignis]